MIEKAFLLALLAFSFFAVSSLAGLSPLGRALSEVASALDGCEREGWSPEACNR